MLVKTNIEKIKEEEAEKERAEDRELYWKGYSDALMVMIKLLIKNK
jgi:hypothetical protein